MNAFVWALALIQVIDLRSVDLEMSEAKGIKEWIGLVSASLTASDSSQGWQSVTFSIIFRTKNHRLSILPHKINRKLCASSTYGGSSIHQ